MTEPFAVPPPPDPAAPMLRLASERAVEIPPPISALPATGPFDTRVFDLPADAPDPAAAVVAAAPEPPLASAEDASGEVVITELVAEEIADAAAASAKAATTRPLAMLDAKSISAWFGDHKVLDRVSLTMAAGRVTALIGPSGCGKSTFLRILNRMHEMIPGATLAGEVLLDGDDIYDPDRRLTDARRQIGMVFQKPNPFPAMSIYDNVDRGLEAHRDARRPRAPRTTSSSHA